MIHLIDNLETLRAESAQWDRVSDGDPFKSWSWQMSWLEHLGQEFQPAVLVDIDDDGLWNAIAPFCIDRTNPFSSRLRFIGSGAACTDYVDLICSDGRYDQFAMDVTEWLSGNLGDEETLGQIDAVELDGIATAQRNPKFLVSLFVANGFKQHVTELEGGWQVDLPKNWDELNSSFSKSKRRKTKKAVQRLADPSTNIVSTRQTPFEEVWPVFRELHQARREMLGQDGCFGDSNFEAFLKSATQRLIVQARAEIVVVETDGQPLASMLLLNDDHCVSMYQSGMDVSRLKMEPGYQVGVCAITRAIDDGFKKFDFLRGDEPYKARWNTTRIPMSRTRLIPRKGVARLKHGIWSGARTLRDFLQADATPDPIS